MRAPTVPLSGTSLTLNSYLVSAAQEHFQREHAQTEAGANFGGARKCKIVAQASLQASRRYIKTECTQASCSSGELIAKAS